jgi:hypothetical protein
VSGGVSGGGGTDGGGSMSGGDGICKAIRQFDYEDDASALASLAYVGIVDILMPFSVVKRFEASVLGVLLGDISCKPPADYASRFAGFVEYIFASAPAPPAPPAAPAPTPAESVAAARYSITATDGGVAESISETISEAISGGANGYASRWLNRPGASAAWPISALHRARRLATAQRQPTEFGKKDFALLPFVLWQQLRHWYCRPQLMRLLGATAAALGLAFVGRAHPRMRFRWVYE